MSNVLTTGSTVTCGYDPTGVTHGGRVVTNSSAKLKINGDRVLAKSGIEGKSIPDCSTEESTSPPQKPCSTVSAVLFGEARKLKVNGSPVMLDTLHGTTDGNPIGTLHADANQDKLTAI